MTEALDKVLRATLSELVDGSSFSEVCQSYHELFDLPIRIFDKEGNLLTEVVHNSAACNYLRKFNAVHKICADTRVKVKSAFPKADKGLQEIDCVCALRYALAPIVFQGEILGKIVLGPYLPAEIERLPADILELDPGLDPNKVKEKLGKMRRISENGIEKISRAILSVIDIILFSAHKAMVTSQMHISSIRESYKALNEKNRQLAEMNEQMKEFERLKSNFLSTVSHELRTPLTSIIGYSDMLAEGIAGELAEEQRQFVQTIKTKGDELLKLISSILDFSQIETGHLKMHLEKINPKEVIDAAVDANNEIANRRGIRLVVDCNEVPESLMLDPGKIQSVISHLVENAVKFSSPGGVVKVSAQLTRPEEDDAMDNDGVGFVIMASPKTLEISVQDFGTGIAEVDQRRIFEPFTQLDNSSTREHGGSGLGLALVKHYTEAHGGRVIVSSDLGEGSKFMVRIPVVDNR